MAYKAKTVVTRKRQQGDAPMATFEIEGAGGVETFDGQTINGQLKAYAGKPPASMLSSNAVHVEDMSGRPWPGSAADRLAKMPNVQRLAELAGDWPDAQERSLQKFAEAKLANPQAVGAAMLKRQGYKDAEIARMLAPRTTDIPDPDELLTQPKQARG